ncbi:MAG: hypothetical protein H7256_11685 [Bdellovibrio sp.]|nr:hypothetical protein [Bdellovibrio sp.]
MQARLIKAIFMISIFCASVAHSDVKPVMDQLVNELFILKPYIVYDEEFRDPKNNEVIKKSLNRMADLSRKINHDDKMKKSAFKISAKILTEQLQDVATIFESGNKVYSLWTLKSTLNVCMSCHTQLPGVSTHFSAANKLSKITNYFNEAEFLFTVKNFDEAMPMYSLAVKNYPTDMKAGDLEKVLLRKAYYYIRVKRNALDLIASLKIDLENKNLPLSHKKSVQDLIQAAGELKSESYPTFTSANEADLKAYVEKELKPILSGDLGFLTDKNLITYLRISSLLYQYIDQNPETPLLPDILYWLAFCERRYTKNMYYSLPDLYLKQCINDFPKNPVAKKCYKEYEEITFVSFTGSSGIHVPSDVKSELSKMKKKVGLK